MAARKQVKAFKGSGRKSSTVEWQGLEQTAFLLAQIVNVDLPKRLNALHTNKIGLLTKYAESMFHHEALRPDESGHRPEKRMTQQFTFGGKGAAFRGFLIEEGNIQGFGYPDVQQADAKTNFVWRSLEFGLTGAKHTAIANPFAPRGVAKFPSRFTFLPFAKGRGLFEPRGGGPARPRGKLVTPQGRILKTVTHPGIEPKLFITRAFNQVAEGMDRSYRQELASTFAKF